MAMLLFASQSMFAQATEPSQFRNHLPIPYLVDTSFQNLIFHDTTHNFDPTGGPDVISGENISGDVDTWAINQVGYTGERLSFLGPTLRWWLGETIDMWTTNNLPAGGDAHGETTTAHWHGLNVKSQADGGPHQAFGTDSTLITNFPIMDSVQTIWYHSHVMEYTTEQVIMGLAGVVNVESATDPYYSTLPHDYGKNDFPIVFQEKGFSFDSSGNVTSMIVSNNPGAAIGHPGNGPYTIINGVAYGVLPVPQEWVKIRVLNGSPRKSFNIGLSPQCDPDTNLTIMDTLWQVGTDGSYTSAPHPMTQFLISPGERGIFILDFTKYAVGDTVYLSNHISSIPNGVMKGTGATPGSPPDSTIDGTPGDAFMAFVVTDTITPTDPIMSPPTSLEPYAILDTSDIAQRRTKRLQFVAGDDCCRWRINGDTMNMAVLNDTVVVNTMEEWTIVNESHIAHPFHIHKVQFQIIEYEDSAAGISGSYPSIPEFAKGFKDVILVMPNSTVKFVARFDHFPDTSINPMNGYMYHCHILTHEDHSMMQQFTVVTQEVYDVATGVVDLDDQAMLVVYPNPAQDMLMLEGTALLPGKLRFIDLQGRVLRESDFAPFMGTKTIDVADLPKGFMFVEWTEGDKSFTRKIILE